MTERVYKVKVFTSNLEERGEIICDTRECAQDLKNLLESYLYIVEVWEIVKWK
ncbi:hypothetical protein JDFR1000234_09 [uncultured archaeal virus]|jgi:hypothetical protein|uniref:Uncharacterized protein n=1 Tax=uncultured archaeal virus TaxID=1960247 RepID=A0A1S5Y301_9VIRU|nr:hypothetical protein JDFR1000234_09 [uncultured archaeal virus]